MFCGWAEAKQMCQAVIWDFEAGLRRRRSCGKLGAARSALLQNRATEGQSDKETRLTSSSTLGFSPPLGAFGTA